MADQSDDRIRKLIKAITEFARAWRRTSPPNAAAPDDVESKDIIRGYYPEDETRVTGMMVTSQPDPAAYIDPFGVKVDPSYCSWVVAGEVGTKPPFPRSYLADGIEFAALGLALGIATDFGISKGRPTFSAVELGAGWGPWTSLAALCAERGSFKDIRLAAFEADPGRFELLRRHLALNGITENRFKLALFCAAAWWRDETMYWPRNADVEDFGVSAVSGERPAQDYRGQAFEFQAIPALSIAVALKDHVPIDFLHIDIQGGEWDLVSHLSDYLTANVRTMFIGTHSRKIEGDLIALLRDQGWILMRERPCQFYSLAPSPTLVGQTYHDGGQFWRNDRLLTE